MLKSDAISSWSFSAKFFFKRFWWLFSFVLFINLFLFRPVGSFGILLWFVGALVFVAGFFNQTKLSKNNKKVAIISCLLTLYFPLTLLFRSFALSNLIAVISGLTLLAFLGGYLLLKSPFWEEIWDLIFLPVNMFIGYLISGISVLGRFFDGRVGELLPFKSELSKWKSVVFGSFLGLAVCLVFGGILASADPIFGSFISQFSFPELFTNVFARLLVSLFVFLFFLPWIYAVPGQSLKPLFQHFLGKYSFKQEIAVLLGFVAALFAMYLFVAWPYIFANVSFETDLSRFGVATYSEYVRKGFLELLFVSILLYGLLGLGMVALKKSWVHVVLTGELLLFIVSIFRRVYLYQSYHGLSLIRIYGSIFLFMIFGLGIIMILRHFIGKRWAPVELGLVLITLMATALINFESIVVNNPPVVNGRVDYIYLSRMSPDGYLGWVNAYNWAGSILEKPRDSLINREDRREIAYAGIIVKNLLGNYVDLMGDNASKTEKNEVMRRLYEDYEKQSRTKLPFGIDKPMYIRFDKTPITDQFNFELTNYHNGSFYSVTAEDMFRDQNGLDRLLALHPGEVSVWQKIQKDMPLDRILDLQKTYFELFKKVTAQPAGEREYDKDISLDAPLLGD